MVGFNDMRTEGTIFPTWSTHIALFVEHYIMFFYGLIYPLCCCHV